MINSVILIGNIAKDIELKYLNNGMPIVNAYFANNKRYTDANGNRQEKAMFIEIKFFGKLAEVASQYLRKGSKIAINGELSFEQWTNQQGQMNSRHSIIVNSFDFLDPNTAPKAPQQQRQGGMVTANDLARQVKAKREAENYNVEADGDSSDEVPF